MNKYLCLILAFTLVLPVYGEVTSCNRSPFSELENITNILELDHNDSMNFDFKLNNDCSYQSSAEIVVLDNEPIETLFERKVMNPELVMEASKGSIKEINFEPQSSYVQNMAAKKFGMSVKISSECKTTQQGDKVVSICTVNPDKAKVQVGVGPLSKSLNLLEHQRSIVECYAVNSEVKKCKFSFEGKANSVPTMNSCKMAMKGAAEGFGATYRLAYIMKHGNLNHSLVNESEKRFSKLFEQVNYNKISDEVSY